MIIVHDSLCQAKDIRFYEVMPGRLLHLRVPGASFSLDVLSFYQFAWRSKQTLTQNQEQRRAALDSLSKTVGSLPQRNTLIVAGDFNMSLRTDRKFAGPCTIGVSKLGQRGAKDFDRLLEHHRLVAANTWAVRKPATHAQGNSIRQIDYVLLRQNQAQGPGKSCSPCRQFAASLERWQLPLSASAEDLSQPEILCSAQEGLRSAGNGGLLSTVLGQDPTVHGYRRSSLRGSRAILVRPSLCHGTSAAIRIPPKRGTTLQKGH